MSNCGFRVGTRVYRATMTGDPSRSQPPAGTVGTISCGFFTETGVPSRDGVCWDKFVQVCDWSPPESPLHRSLYNQAPSESAALIVFQGP